MALPIKRIFDRDDFETASAIHSPQKSVKSLPKKEHPRRLS